MDYKERRNMEDLFEKSKAIIQAAVESNWDVQTLKRR